jgi:hypothetical protein
MAKRLPKKDLDKQLGQNPYVSALCITASIFNSGNFKKSTNDTGEVVMLPDTYEKDDITSTEVYLTAGAKAIICNLSDKSQRLLFHIIYTLEKGRDYFRMNVSDYMAKNKIKSKTTVSTALAELKRYGIVSASSIQGYYFVNPSILFGGSRVRYYTKESLPIKENKEAKYPEWQIVKLRYRD